VVTRKRMTAQERAAQRYIEFYLARAYVYVFLTRPDLVEESLKVVEGLMKEIEKVFPRDEG
jgi:hypothetical protein